MRLWRKFFYKRVSFFKKMMNIIDPMFTLFENIGIIAPMVVCIWAVFAVSMLEQA